MWGGNRGSEWQAFSFTDILPRQLRRAKKERKRQLAGPRVAVLGEKLLAIFPVLWRPSAVQLKPRGRWKVRTTRCVSHVGVA